MFDKFYWIGAGVDFIFNGMVHCSTPAGARHKAQLAAAGEPETAEQGRRARWRVGAVGGVGVQGVGKSWRDQVARLVQKLFKVRPHQHGG